MKRVTALRTVTIQLSTASEAAIAILRANGYRITGKIINGVAVLIATHRKSYRHSYQRHGVAVLIATHK